MTETRGAAPRKRVVKSADQRRDEIMAAALDLFKRKGFGETTVGDIAAAADTAIGTLYLYFPSKDHILLALHARYHEGMSTAITEVAADVVERRARGEEISYRDTIDQVVQVMADYMQECRDYAEVCMRHLPATDLEGELAKTQMKFVGYLTAILYQSTAMGVIHVTDPEMMAHLIHGAMYTSLSGWAAYGQPADLERLLASARELLYKALAPDESSGAQ